MTGISATTSIAAATFIPAGQKLDVERSEDEPMPAVPESPFDAISRATQANPTQINQTIETIARFAGAVQGAEWELANLDFLRANYIANVGEKGVDEYMSAKIEGAQRTISGMGGWIEGNVARLERDYRVTGTILETDAQGNRTLGSFTISGAGEGMSFKLDSEKGWTITDLISGRVTKSDSSVALLREDLAREPRLLDRIV